MIEELIATIDYSKRIDIDLEFKKDDVFLSLEDQPLSELRKAAREWVKVQVDSINSKNFIQMYSEIFDTEKNVIIYITYHNMIKLSKII